MKSFLLAFLFICSSACAQEITLGVGYAHAVTVQKGFWYDSWLPNKLDMNSIAWRAGVGLPLSSSIKIHADVVNTGVQKSDAIAPDRFGTKFKFIGHGSENGVDLTVEKHGEYFGVDIGGHVYRQVWVEDTRSIDPPGTNGHYPSGGGIHVAPTVGLGLHYGRVSLRVDELFLCVLNTCKNQQVPGIAGSITTFTINLAVL
jgi:hypothetical protein